MFFKWIKQNLRIKTFYSTSPNAVMTQIWIAMVVYLVLSVLKEQYHLDLAMSKLLHFFEVNLFEQKLLHSNFQTNSRYERYEDKQLKLFNFYALFSLLEITKCRERIVAFLSILHSKIDL